MVLQSSPVHPPPSRSLLQVSSSPCYLEHLSHTSTTSIAAPMAFKHSTTRKSSDAENMGLKQKPYRKIARTVSSTLRDTSLRRRNRVISGLSMPKFILSNARRQKAIAAACPKESTKPKDFCFTYTLPTPPASPMCSSPAIADAGSSRKLSLQFPRRLVRPAPKPLSLEDAKACDPQGLQDVPAAYVRQSLNALGPQMLQVLSGIRAPPFRSDNGLPKELVVLAHDLSAQMPTHLLAVYGKPEGHSTPVNRTSMTVYPVHDIVLRSNCANLPQMPFSAPPPPRQRGGPLVLPMVPLMLPHPQSYPQIHNYLYTKDHVRFFMSMLPHPPVADDEATEQYCKNLASTYSAEKLISLLRQIHGVYRNMCALDIQDDMMWGLLNVAWEILLTSLTIHSNMPHLSPLAVHD